MVLEFMHRYIDIFIAHTYGILINLNCHIFFPGPFSCTCTMVFIIMFLDIFIYLLFIKINWQKLCDNILIKKMIVHIFKHPRKAQRFFYDCYTHLYITHPSCEDQSEVQQSGVSITLRFKFYLFLNAIPTSLYTLFKSFSSCIKHTGILTTINTIVRIAYFNSSESSIKFDPL